MFTSFGIDSCGDAHPQQRTLGRLDAVGDGMFIAGGRRTSCIAARVGYPLDRERLSPGVADANRVLMHGDAFVASRHAAQERRQDRCPLHRIPEGMRVGQGDFVA